MGCDSTATHVPNELCEASCGACCQDNKFKSQCDVNSEFSLGSCDDTCGACCDNGSCQLRLDTSCNNGVFQGTGSACTSNTCPLGNVCCQDDINQPCLTGANDVEQC